MPSAAGADAATPGGRYLTVWIRERDAWRVALDLSLPDCGAGAATGRGDFDFWAGHWIIAQHIIADRGGPRAFPARNVVTRLDGCALVERWQGTVLLPWAGMAAPEEIRGASLRVLDPSSGQWRIYWIDTLSGDFGAPFEGAFEGEKGEFIAAATDVMPERRIRFIHAGAAAGWELAVRQPDGSWLPIWTMDFERPD